MGTVSVIGLGNVLLGDDAIGPLVTAHLQARFHIPAGVEVLDLGTPGLNLQPYLHDRSALVLVDAIRSSAPAGTIERYDRDDLMRRPPPPRVSPHDLGLKESLRLAELAEGRPIPVTLVGVVVERTAQGEAMGPSVAAALDPALDAVRRALLEHDVRLEPRELHLEPNIWWSKTTGE
jgi:hydrogenase maturation protease